MKKRKLEIRMIGLGISVLMLFGSLNVQAQELVGEQEETGKIISDTQMSIEQIWEYYDVEALALKYGVDADELACSIYEGIHSDKFSPFSQLESSKLPQEERNELKGSPVYSQDSTMFLETGNNCASGVYPYVGCVAVHKKSATNAEPVIPFGTRITYLSGSVNINGSYFDTFTVEDTGDSKFVRSTYWTDVFGGENTEANRKMAAQYGVQTVVISWN